MRRFIDHALYQLHSAIAHWHAARFERHWRAASKASRRISQHALHNVEIARADPNRPA